MRHPTADRRWFTFETPLASGFSLYLDIKKLVNSIFRNRLLAYNCLLNYA